MISQILFYDFSNCMSVLKSSSNILSSFRTGRMPPATCTDSICNVINDVVISMGTDTTWDVIEVQCVAEFPSDVVIGA